MQVVKRTGSGRQNVESYEAAALKDVVYLGTNGKRNTWIQQTRHHFWHDIEEVEVIADFAPWSGLYMFHCHNLIHEDHDMMAAMNITKADLSSYGYPESVDFGDPLLDIFAAKPYPGSTNYNQVRDVLLPYYQSLNAYPDAAGVEAALSRFYAQPTSTTAAPSTFATSTRVATTTSKPTTTSITKKTTTTTTTTKKK